jgi:hypothetical protein
MRPAGQHANETEDVIPMESGLPKCPLQTGLLQRRVVDRNTYGYYG